MTDSLSVSERLRAVLSDETLLNIHKAADFDEPDGWVNVPIMRDAVVDALLPLLTELQEEQAREMREALLAEVGIALKVRMNVNRRGYCYWREADEVLSRLASSSSPAAPQE